MAVYHPLSAIASFQLTIKKHHHISPWISSLIHHHIPWLSHENSHDYPMIVYDYPMFSSHFPTFPLSAQAPAPPVAQPGAARASGPPCARSPGRSKGAAPAVSPAPGVGKCWKFVGGLLICWWCSKGKSFKKKHNFKLYHVISWCYIMLYHFFIHVILVNQLITTFLIHISWVDLLGLTTQWDPPTLGPAGPILSLVFGSKNMGWFPMLYYALLTLAVSEQFPFQSGLIWHSGFHQRLPFLKTPSRNVVFSDGFIPDLCTIRMRFKLDGSSQSRWTSSTCTSWPGGTGDIRWPKSPHIPRSSQRDHHPFRLTSHPTSVCCSPCSPEKVMRSNHKWGVYHDLPDLPSNSDGQELWKLHQNGDLTKKNWDYHRKIGDLPEMEAYHSVTSISLGKWWEAMGVLQLSYAILFSEKPTWETGEVGENTICFPRGDGDHLVGLEQLWHGKSFFKDDLSTLFHHETGHVQPPSAAAAAAAATGAAQPAAAVAARFPGVAIAAVDSRHQRVAPGEGTSCWGWPMGAARYVFFSHPVKTKHDRCTVLDIPKRSIYRLI